MADREQIENRLIQLRIQYQEQLPQRLAEIYSLWSALKAGDRTKFLQLVNCVHRLSGSGAAFGFPEITEEAGRLEQLLEASQSGRELTLPVAEIEGAINSLADRTLN